MKTFVVLAVSIILVGILFCPMAMAFPALPDDLQMVQPDPSLPKELSAFFGKWEGGDGSMNFFYIVEKIDEKNATLYISRSRPVEAVGVGWQRYEAKVIQERAKYKVWFFGPFGPTWLIVKGKYLDMTHPMGQSTFRLRRFQ